MRRRLNPFSREHESLTTNTKPKAPTTSSLLAEKRALTTDEQDYIISSAEEELLMNDKIAHYSFLFLILLEAFVFFFFSVSDLRTFLHRADVNSRIFLEGGEAGATGDRLLESGSHFVVSILAFSAAYLTFGRRSLRRISERELAMKQKSSTKKDSASHVQPRMEMKYDDRHEDSNQSLPPPTAAFPPPPVGGASTTYPGMPPPPVFPSIPPAIINSNFNDLVEAEVAEDDEDVITITLNHANIARVTKVHKAVAALSILIAAPLLFLSAVFSSTHESPFAPTKVLLYLWQPLQHLLLAWAAKALVEDVMESVGLLKKTKYKHQDA